MQGGFLAQVLAPVRNALEDWQSARASDEALQSASQASEESYNGLAEEYRASLVNNLEVLDALRRYQNVQRSQNAAHFLERKNYWKLRVALGDVPGTEL